MKAKMLNFYPSITDRACEKMPYRLFIQYFNAISVIEAERRLVDLNVALYPDLKPSARSKLYGHFKRASGMIKRKTVLKDFKDVMANIARKLNG